jgi:hypothetical protein
LTGNSRPHDRERAWWKAHRTGVADDEKVVTLTAARQ